MEKKKFLVCPIEEGLETRLLRIVNAPNKEEAIAKYARQVLIKDKYYLEHVYSSTIDASFAEQFFVEVNGRGLDERVGDGADPEQAQRHLQENVRGFFKDRQDFADLYLDFFHNDDSRSFDEAMEKWQFSEDMLVYMCLGDIAFFGELAVLELSEIEEIG
jgi:hypothetical protein